MREFKKWKINSVDSVSSIMSKYGINELAAKVVASRMNKISPDEFFDEIYEISSPFELKDIDNAVERINLAVDAEQKITVYGDYDVDGITATVILYSYLEAMGAQVDYYIPNREEGYGLNKDAVKQISENGTDLIVTVDNGISATEEIKYALSLGMDVVVTDHHMPQGETPPCICVDPHRIDCLSKFKDICGAFVTFKLVAALDGGEYDSVFQQYAELVAIATVADAVPLTGENRTIVKLGIEKIKDTDNIGLHTLINKTLSTQTVIDTTAVTYYISPYLNSAGRMGDAERACKLLLSEDMSEAEEIVNELCTENEKRKEIEADILSEISRMLENDPMIMRKRVVVVAGENWHKGVVGIVASKLVEMTGKPSIVFSCNNSVATGSARSTEGFELFDAIFSCKDLTLHFGGHSLAAGLTVECDKLYEFTERINEYARNNYKYMPINEILCDAEIIPEEISVKSVKELSLLNPFGKNNPTPIFAIKNITVKSVSSVGNGKHSKMIFLHPAGELETVYFGTAADSLSCYVGNNVDIAVKLKPNYYQDTVSVSISIVDIRPCKINDELFFKEKQLFEFVSTGENINEKQARYLLPEREEAAAVYRKIKQNSGIADSLDLLYCQLSMKINRARISVISEALCQCSLAEYKNGKLSLLNSDKKADLFACDIMQKILTSLKV